VAWFHADRRPAGDPEAARDLGVGLVQLATEGRAPALPATRRALPLLDAAIARHPDDLPARAARADALVLQTRLLDALAANEDVLARAPRREQSLGSAATLAEDLRQADRALGYWRRAAEVNPWMPRYRRHLAGLLADRGAWDEAREHVRAWLRLDPGSPDARQFWIRCLLHEGKKGEARAEFARLEALDPPDLPALRAWFAEQAR
jgi:tetratricopeptide (TPR) repeat protein